MSYDEGLAERIREYFHDNHKVEEKKMFGGLCFLLSNHMCCGIVKETLMARVGPAHYDQCLSKPYASEMDFTGKAMRGMVYVAPKGIESDEALAEWLAICKGFVESLPPKDSKKKIS